MAGEELCQDCGARVASIKMKRHRSINHDKEEKICDECKTVCVGKKLYYNHMRNHGSQAHCKFCWKGSPKSQISQHMKSCTKIKILKYSTVSIVHLKVHLNSRCKAIMIPFM